MEESISKKFCPEHKDFECHYLAINTDTQVTSSACEQCKLENEKENLKYVKITSNMKKLKTNVTKTLKLVEAYKKKSEQMINDKRSKLVQFLEKSFEKFSDFYKTLIENIKDHQLDTTTTPRLLTGDAIESLLNKYLQSLEDENSNTDEINMALKYHVEGNLASINVFLDSLFEGNKIMNKIEYTADDINHLNNGLEDLVSEYTLNHIRKYTTLIDGAPQIYNEVFPKLPLKQNYQNLALKSALAGYLSEADLNSYTKCISQQKYNAHNIRHIADTFLNNFLKSSSLYSHNQNVPALYNRNSVLKEDIYLLIYSQLMLYFGNNYTINAAFENMIEVLFYGDALLYTIDGTVRNFQFSENQGRDRSKLRDIADNIYPENKFYKLKIHLSNITGKTEGDVFLYKYDLSLFYSGLKPNSCSFYNTSKNFGGHVSLSDQIKFILDSNQINLFRKVSYHTKKSLPDKSKSKDDARELEKLKELVFQCDDPTFFANKTDLNNYISKFDNNCDKSKSLKQIIKEIVKPIFLGRIEDVILLSEGRVKGHFMVLNKNKTFEIIYLNDRQCYEVELLVDFKDFSKVKIYLLSDGFKLIRPIKNCVYLDNVLSRERSEQFFLQNYNIEMCKLFEDYLDKDLIKSLLEFELKNDSPYSDLKKFNIKNFSIDDINKILKLLKEFWKKIDKDLYLNKLSFFSEYFIYNLNHQNCLTFDEENFNSIIKKKLEFNEMIVTPKISLKLDLIFNNDYDEKYSSLLFVNNNERILMIYLEDESEKLKLARSKEKQEFSFSYYLDYLDNRDIFSNFKLCQISDKEIEQFSMITFFDDKEKIKKLISLSNLEKEGKYLDEESRKELKGLLLDSLTPQIKGNKEVTFRIDDKPELGFGFGKAEILLKDGKSEECCLDNKPLFKVPLVLSSGNMDVNSVVYALAESGNIVKFDEESKRGKFITLDGKSEEVCEINKETKSLIKNATNSSFIKEKQFKTFFGESTLILDYCNYKSYITPMLDNFKMEYHYYNNAPSNFEELLKKSNQLWIISSSTGDLSGDHLNLISEYYEKGLNLYLFGDNDYLYLQANQVLVKLGFGNFVLKGNYLANKYVSRETFENEGYGLYDHVIFNDVGKLYEGHSVSCVNESAVNNHTNFQPLIRGSDKILISVCYQDNKNKIIIDGGFTRLGNINEESTKRYICNCIEWLSKSN